MTDRDEIEQVVDCVGMAWSIVWLCLLPVLLVAWAWWPAPALQRETTQPAGTWQTSPFFHVHAASHVSDADSVPTSMGRDPR